MLTQKHKDPPLNEITDQISNSSHLSHNHGDERLTDEHGNELSKKIGKWTPEEDELLRKYVPIFGEKQWRKISQNIPGRTSIQCLHRWTKILKPGLVKGPWTPEEDQKLITWVNTEGATKWAQCANFIKGRSGKQCRERWFNNLNPGVKKGNWSKEEDELIFKLYQKYGSSWSKIAKFLPGRTENAIKNRFYSTLRKLAADKRKGKPDNHEGLSSKHEDDDFAGKGDMDTAEPPNTLYALLNEKTCALPDQEEEKKELSLPKTKPKASVVNEKSDKQQQSFNVNGEKVLVVRDPKINEENIQEAANKLLNAEIEDNDVAFENFLTSLHANMKEDFITKEFEQDKKQDDIGQLDELQTKILNFCQTNIKDLAETFKMIETNKASTTASEISCTEVKEKLSIQPAGPCLPNMKPEINIQQESQNTRGPTIITPIPNNQRGFSLKLTPMSKTGGLNYSPNKVGNAFSLYNPKTINYSPTNQKAFEQRVDILVPTQNRNQANALKNTPMQFTRGGNSSHLHEKDTRTAELEDTERRMLFLFQQLFSLEILLAKTRNDLAHFESSFDPKHSNEESLKFEDISSNNENINSKQSRNQKAMENLNSEFEQILKKKKV